MAKWKTVEDKNVRMVWCCDDPDCTEDKDEREITVDPSFYMNNGEPMCGCGQDMIYLRTEVLCD